MSETETESDAPIKDRLKVLSDKGFYRPVAPPPEGAPIPPLAFNFSYAGLPFHGEVEQGATPTVRLTARLAPLPYTAEAPELRAKLLELIRDSGRMSRGRLVIDRNRDLWLAGKVAASSAANPVSILAAATTLILDMKPYLETMTRLFEALHNRPDLQEPQASPDAEAAPAG